MPLTKPTLAFLLAIFAVQPARAAGLGGGADCQKMPTPQQMCENYSVSSLGQDKNVQEARPSCEAFYKTVIDSLNVFCHYATDQRVGETAAKVQAFEDSGRQTFAFAEDRAALTQSHNLLTEYIDAALDARDKMSAAAKESKNKLGELAEKAEAVQKTELDCEGSGTPGAAVGVMAVGLAKYSLEEQLDTKAQLDRQIKIFTVKLSAIQHLFKGRAQAMQQVGTNMNTAGATPAPSSQTADQLAQAGVPREQGFTESRKDMDLKAGDKAIEKGVGHVAEHELERMMARGAAMEGAKVSALKAAPIAGVAVFDLLTAEKKDGLTFFKVGALAAVTAISSSAVVAIGAGLAADYIENKIRNKWIRDDIAIIQPYVNFLKDHPTGSSTQAAAQYKGEKEKADYCKKCGPADIAVRHYCPAQNKYNPNFWSSVPLPCPADGPNAGKRGCPQQWNNPEANR